MRQKSSPFLVAIVGGSASGKSWLADRLQKFLGDNAARLSLDNFYLDRSHLPPGRRARINYDHPRAIDWKSLEKVLQACQAGRATRIPRYDFATHSRHRDTQLLRPKPVILVEGLWLLHRRALRRIFGLSIFIECPARTRLDRRLARDVALRGRNRESVRRQFLECVEPMHALHVAPQAHRADLRLRAPVKKSDLNRLVKHLTLKIMSTGKPH